MKIRSGISTAARADNGCMNENLVTVAPAPSHKSSQRFGLPLVVGVLLGILSVGVIAWVMLSGNSGRSLLSRMMSFCDRQNGHHRCKPAYGG